MAASPQVEDGFTRIADELLEALCSAHLGAREMAVFLAIVRKTYGWGKKSDTISGSQLSNLTGIPRAKIPSLIASLEAKNMIDVKRGPRCAALVLSVKKDHQKWQKRISPKRKLGASEAAPKKVASTAPKKVARSAPKSGAHNREDKQERQTPAAIASRPMLTPARVRLLIEIKPFGVEYSEDEVQAWFTRIEPIMRANGVKQPVRAAANWWKRARTEEVRDALRWVEMQSLDDLRGKPDEREKDSIEAFGDAFGIN